MRKIGPNAHRAKLQVMTTITNVCTVKARAGCLLAVASKRHRDILAFPSSPPGDSNDRRTEVRNPFCSDDSVRSQAGHTGERQTQPSEARGSGKRDKAKPTSYSSAFDKRWPDLSDGKMAYAPTQRISASHTLEREV